MLKELGKMLPKLRDKEDPFLGNYKRVVQAREKRLFIKNTGLCQHVSGCIGSDACPVLEG